MPPAKADRTKQETNLIMGRIVLLSFILFFNSVSTSYLYSFLPDMMVDLGMVDSVTSSGTYASWMASGFFAGRTISSSFWGSMIDQYGRKNGLIVIMAGVSFCTLLFGFSTSYYYALAIRVITGFVNGLSIVGKTLSTEICPDDLKSWSISVTNTIWALGLTVGPFIGSFFYKTIEGWPYILSSTSVAILGFILTGLSWWYFEETLPAKTKKTNMPEPGPKFEKLDDSATTPGEDSEMPGSAVLPPPQPSKMEQFKQVFTIPNITQLVTIFCVNTFFAAVIGELYPFWMAAKYVNGGLGFSHHDISQVYGLLTAPQLILQIFMYPIIQKSMGDFWLLVAGHVLHLPLYFFTPYAHWFSEGSMMAQKSWVIFWLFMRNIASFMNFSALQRLTNDAIKPDKRGKLNGYQIMISSCLQISGPFFGGFLLAWSMENGWGYPLNYHFVFLLMCLVTVGTLKVIYRLQFIDEKKLKLKGENTAQI